MIPTPIARNPEKLECFEGSIEKGQNNIEEVKKEVGAHETVIVWSDTWVSFLE